jgi:hypothetical protein
MSMNQVTKFTLESAEPISSTEAPDWIREMSEHYAQTGTVRESGAARLERTSSSPQILTAPATEKRDGQG